MIRDIEREWREQAACVDVNSELFFPDPPATGGGLAKQVCRGCPVRIDCLEFALANHERYGIWGGLNEKERNRLRRQRRLQTRRIVA